LEHRKWDERHAQPLRASIRPHQNNRDPEKRLRIGFVSPDFRDHVVGRNILPLFEHRNRDQLEFFVYGDVLWPDGLTEEFQRLGDGWRSVLGLTDEQAAQVIRQDQVDILVDLTLHMANSRLLTFARRPAPVQVTYLGYCGTTGLSAMDYRLSDAYLDPPGTNLSDYSEQTIRLPGSYWCYKPKTDTPEPVAPPALSTGSITFGCLNNFAKVSAASLDAWGGILRAVPESRLVLHASSGTHRQRTLETFARSGVQPGRIEFVAGQPYHDYIKTYERIDISLDPFPYAGGITSCDSLWMGVPVVTLAGTQSPVSRGGCSILGNVGLTELIAPNVETYQSIAVNLANDLPRLANHRSALRQKMLESPLMNTARFTRNMEAVYRQIWRKWCATPR